ncbi:MAG: HAMP domain-containing sensor histidine kinase [Candidatus Izemoplasmatales bacterium]|nr:HAMP domain-containing sensor histidine kinase [Candidatus Izemoplasmatales bacterium]
MKRFGIQGKIVFLITIFFTVLVLIDLAFLVTYSEEFFSGSVESDLVSVTQSAVQEITIDDGVVYKGDEDDHEELFSFVKDGVVFLIYQSGVMKYGTSPSSFDPSFPMTIGETEVYEGDQGTWLVYDVSLSGSYVLRGLYPYDVVASSANQLVKVALIISPILIVFAAFGSFVIIHRSFKPIQKIYETAQSIEASGDLSKRIENIPGRDEVASLAMMVNQMLDKVESTLSRERMFSSNVSHELRTPLTVLKAQAEYMLVKLAPNSPYRKDVETILSQVESLESITVLLLEITRNHQSNPAQWKPVSVGVMVDEIFEHLEKERSEKNIMMTKEHFDASSVLVTDSAVLQRVLFNLIHNAIRYNKQDGQLTVRFSRQQGSVHLVVEDRGIGISEENIAHVFDPFYQVDPSRKRMGQGVGLGLAIVKEMVTMLEGTIEIQSVLGESTTVTVILPDQLNAKG